MRLFHIYMCVYLYVHKSAEVVWLVTFSTPVGKSCRKHCVCWVFTAVKCREEVKFMLIKKPLCLFSGD